MSVFGTVTGVLMVCVGSGGQAQLMGADWAGVSGLPLNPFTSKGSPSMGMYE